MKTMAGINHSTEIKIMKNSRFTEQDSSIGAILCGVTENDEKQQSDSVTKLTLSIRMHVPKSANFR